MDLQSKMIGLMKPDSDLPPHISFEQKEALKNAVIGYYLKKRKTRKTAYFVERDRLLIEFLFHTGARIGDALQFKMNQIDYDRMWNLTMQKTKKLNQIALDANIILDLKNFCDKYKIDIDRRIFEITKTAAWYNIKKYGEMTQINIHPHTFRHSMAVHMLRSNIPLPIISNRLGHSNIWITVSMYMKITPDIKRSILPLLNKPISNKNDY